MLEAAFLVAFIVLFLHVTTWEGMIFQQVAQVLHRLPQWIKKPLFDCPICMAPWWGCLLLLAMQDYLPIYLDMITGTAIVFAAGAINAVLIYIITYARNEARTED